MLLPVLTTRRWLPALLLAVLALLGRPARASHLLGGEMTYQYLDANGPAKTPFQYQITVTTYYNPFSTTVPVPAASVPVVLFDRTTEARISSVNAPLVSSSPIVQPRLASGCTVQGPNQPFRVLRYTVVVALPATLDGYYAVCSQTARNTTLTNVRAGSVGRGGNVPMTLYVSMTPPLIYNRSPIFTDTAVAIVCQYDTTLVLNSAVDPDGDRLVYAFGTPYGVLSSTTSFPPLPGPVPYNAGYSAADPFGVGAGNFALLNANTGVARYGATTQGQYAIAVDVSEYRRTSSGAEILLGTTRRDLQLVVANCPPNTAPQLAAAAVLPRAYTIEAGQSLSIPITATQRDGHPLVMMASSTLLDGAGSADATFNGDPGTVASGALVGTAMASGTGTVVGTFVLHSTCANARANPYDIPVVVQDQSCAGKTVVEVFRITVVPPTGPTAIAGDATVCGLPTTRAYTASGGTAGGVSWRAVGGTIVGSPTANPVQVTWTAATGGTLIARGLSPYGCLADSVSQSISVVPVPALAVAAPGGLAICEGSSTTISVSGAGTAYTATGGPVAGTGSTFTLSPTQTTTYTITSVQRTVGGCASTAQVTVVVAQPTTGPLAGAVSVCPTVAGIAYSVPANPDLTYQWTVTGGTVASGQGTAAITVDWGRAGAGAVSVVATNSQGCVSAATTLPVTINQVLQTVQPSGPTSVCLADGPYRYTTLAINGSSFAWQLFGTAQGTLTSTGPSTSIAFATGGVAKLVVTQTSDPAGGICRGVSDTLYITVKPSPAPNLAIEGPGRFCVGSAQPYILAGMAGSTYSWQLDGAALASTGSSVSLPASTAVGTYTLTARETSAGGCVGPLYTRTLTVDPRPGAIAISGPRFVCPAARTLTYSVPNATATSTYQWTVAGGTLASGQGTPTVTVSFPASLAANATVSVVETSQYGCAGAAVAATVVPDNAEAPQLALASVVATDNTKVTLTFSVANPAATPGAVQVLRREAGSAGPYRLVGTAAATATTFVDATANAAQTAYQYSLALTNGCGDALAGPAPHTTVLLRAVAVPGTPGNPRDQGGSNLTWTAYEGFAVANYLVYKQNDGGGYQLLATLPGTTYAYTTPNGGQGFDQCFRVVAVGPSGITGGALQANSNTACVEFTNGLAFYNIITPNNDGQNDKLEILNVQLYPGNTMQIFNRWGRQVYSTSNYDNETNYWGTDPSVAPGVYYYLFKLPSGSTTKGWVEVVK